MSKNNVLLRVDCATASALTKIKALGTPLDELIGKQNKINSGFGQTKKRTESMSGALKFAGDQAMRSISNMAAGLVSIHTVAQLITQELQAIRQVEGNFAQNRRQISNQFIAAQRVAVDGVTPSSLAAEAVRRGADPLRFGNAFAAASSTSGAALNKEQLFDIASTVSKEFPELTSAEDQKSMAGVIASLSSASGDTPISIAGKLQGYTRSVPAFDTSGAVKSLQPIAQMLNVGDPEQLQALGISSPEALSAHLIRLATVQNRSRDEAGSQSTTAYISGNMQFLEKGRAKGLLTEKSNMLEVFAMQDDTTDPKIKALKEELLGGRGATSPDVLAMLDKAKAEGRTFTPEEEALIARRAATTGDKAGKGVGGDLSVERKSELAIREMLSGGNSEFQDQMLRSTKNIPVSSEAAEAQFKAQQKLLRGDKVTSAAFLNLETEAANNSMALLAGGADEAGFLNDELKVLAEKAARVGGSSVSLAGYKTEMDTFIRGMYDPTSISPEQRSKNQDNIVKELRAIRDQLKDAGKNQPYERRKQLEDVAGIFTNMADTLTRLFAAGSDQNAVRQGALQAEEDRNDAFEDSLNSGLPLGASDEKKQQAIALRNRANRIPGDTLAPAASKEIAALFGDTEGERLAARIAQGFANAAPRLSPREAAQLSRQSTTALSDSFSELGILMPDSLSDRLGALSENPELQATFSRIQRERLSATTERQIAARDPESVHPLDLLVRNPFTLFGPFLPKMRRGRSPGGTADLLPKYDLSGEERADFNRRIQGAGTSMFSKTDADEVKRILTQINEGIMRLGAPRNPASRTDDAAAQALPKAPDTKKTPAEEGF